MNTDLKEKLLVANGKIEQAQKDTAAHQKQGDQATAAHQKKVGGGGGASSTLASKHPGFKL